MGGALGGRGGVLNDIFPLDYQARRRMLPAFVGQGNQLKRQRVTAGQAIMWEKVLCRGIRRRTSNFTTNADVGYASTTGWVGG